MKEAFVNICNVPTRIITYGGWVEESMDDVREVAICITGNPGLPGFYGEFCETLHERLEKKMPVWVIGHAGHDDPPENSLREVPQLKGNEELFDLDGQIRHKIEFIEKYVPENVKIHLMGHSIGAWMVLQLLRNESIRKRIKKCYLLFPTIERMIESPNGWTFTKIGLPLYSVFGFLIALLNRLPKLLLVLLVQIYFWFSSIPSNHLNNVLGYIKATVTEKVVFLAEDEMARVCGLQKDIIRNNMPLLKLYYGTTDGWVPVKYYNQLKEQFPDIDAQLDTKKIDHSFVLRHSKQMGNIIGDMIIENSEILGTK
ncbi:lipid droplet-associated hydrolase-like [Musca vetustissima]|uniref:lipid droplet-associated hydrolase-like n=1 Tax=Musca vetustissima TaxID=27455 RepID=UPI002AB769B8|nr:lipid droplet-associated hydrolase-like [Musca vetustissima]